MPVPMMALLALILFGALGTLLATALILEHSLQAHAPKRKPRHPMTTLGPPL
jgi:hypothetical protein